MIPGLPIPPSIPLPRQRQLHFPEGFVVMGIINVTPDSFHAASRRRTVEEACVTALAMLESGASIVDVGGESTRPGAPPVSVEEELERVIPAIEAIRARTDAPISVDSRRAHVARAAMVAGADIINDVSGARDPAMFPVALEHDAALVLMHMRGEPATMQSDPAYEDVVAEVRDYLASRASLALESGLSSDRIILDPGIGFGKHAGHNRALIQSTGTFAELGFHLLLGISRKKIIGDLTGRGVEERLAGSLGAACAAVAGGATIIRTHDVPQTLDALTCFRAMSPGSRTEREVTR